MHVMVCIELRHSNVHINIRMKRRERGMKKKKKKNTTIVCAV